MPHLSPEFRSRMSVTTKGVLQNHAEAFTSLLKRVEIPINGSTSPGQIKEMAEDPWSSSGKYALGWVYFGVLLLFGAAVLHLYHHWSDKFRIAQCKEQTVDTSFEASALYKEGGLPTAASHKSAWWLLSGDATSDFSQPTTQRGRRTAVRIFDNVVAVTRSLFYRPIPTVRVWRSKIRPPALPVVLIFTAGLSFSLLYCFIPRPLLFSSMTFGSPPLAIRAGMLAVGLLPWIIALASKVNLISYFTGISVHHLISLHQWAAYLFLILALIHVIPFWWQSVHDPIGFRYFKQYFDQYDQIFISGIITFVLLLLIFLHSLSILRRNFHVLFTILHIPLSWGFTAMMFWHCHNYLTSWRYLYATVALLAVGLVGRLFYVNWSNPTRTSFMIGDEASIEILAGNASKLTVVTQKKWMPGQYVHVKLPGVAKLESHPLPITSTCNNHHLSIYGERYYSMQLLCPPSKAFSRKVLESATDKGPYKMYRTLIEGPYGGMRRQMSSFDQVIFFAGGSGMSAVISHLQDLVHRMRGGKAITTVVHVIWAMQKSEIMSWFGSDLHSCKMSTPPGSVNCTFYITSALRFQTTTAGRPALQLSLPVQDTAISMNGSIHGSTRSNDPMSQVETGLMRSNEEWLTALPQTHLAPSRSISDSVPHFSQPLYQVARLRRETRLPFSVAVPTNYAAMRKTQYHRSVSVGSRLTRFPMNDATLQTFDFGFQMPSKHSLVQHSPTPSTPSRATYKSKKPPNLSVNTEETTQFCAPSSKLTGHYQPQNKSQASSIGWKTEYGRPDISSLLRLLSKDFGHRTCVFVCGPSEMRADVARTVAELQRTIWQHPDRAELFLHTDDWGYRSGAR